MRWSHPSQNHLDVVSVFWSQFETVLKWERFLNQQMGSYSISVSVWDHYHGYWDRDRFLNPGPGAVHESLWQHEPWQKNSEKRIARRNNSRHMNWISVLILLSNRLYPFHHAKSHPSVAKILISIKLLWFNITSLFTLHRPNKLNNAFWRPSSICEL